MNITVEAIYENGLLKLTEPLPLKEHEKVRITVHSKTSVSRETAGMIEWTGEVETLERIACDPEFDQYHHRGHPELYFLSNLDENGRPNGEHPDRGTMFWHTDGSWTKRRTRATLIYSVEVPRQGGETHFADMYRAYETLDPEMNSRIADLCAVHNLDFSRRRRHGEDPMTEDQKRQVPPVEHPIVRVHPETGRKCIYLGDHAETIVGMDYEQGRVLIEELNRLATRPELVYEHKWRSRELIVWDNRCVLHRATGYDTARERRVMRRATVLEEQLGQALA